MAPNPASGWIRPKQDETHSWTTEIFLSVDDSNAPSHWKSSKVNTSISSDSTSEGEETRSDEDEEALPKILYRDHSEANVLRPLPLSLPAVWTLGEPLPPIDKQHAELVGDIDLLASEYLVDCDILEADSGVSFAVMEMHQGGLKAMTEPALAHELDLDSEGQSVTVEAESVTMEFDSETQKKIDSLESMLAAKERELAMWTAVVSNLGYVDRCR